MNRPLPNGKNKTVTSVMKVELGGKIMNEFLGLGAKTYSYLIDEGKGDKNVKATQNCGIKRKFNLEIIKTV